MILRALYAMLLLSNLCVESADKKKKMKRYLRVINGTDTDDYPFVVVLIYKMTPRLYLRQCTGSLVSQNWVLTAAHCDVENFESNFGVVYGDLTVPPQQSKYYRNVLYAVNHEGFRNDEIKKTNDISLVLIDRLDIKPGKLSAVDYKTLTGRSAKYVGAGLSITDNARNKHVVMALMKNDTVRPLQLGKGIIVKCDKTERAVTAALICLRSSCSNVLQRIQVGDSGGPLIYKGKIVGVASYVYKNTNKFTYTAISPYLDWIRMKTSQVSISFI